jgi:recombination protein RecA
MNDNLLKVLADIDKQFGKGSTITGDQKVPIQRISTGSFGLDIATGGGYGEGRMVEVYGLESSGKTTLIIHGMIEAQKKYPNKHLAIIDSEHAFDTEYATMLGLDCTKLVVSQPSNGEEGLEIMDRLVSSGEFSFIALDSIATLVPKAELEGEMTDSSMGLQARMMGKALRKLTGLISKSNTVVIFSNQVREKLGVMFGNPETTPGGNAMKFYASQRIKLNKSQGDKGADGIQTNTHIKATVIKNKLAPPFKTCEYDIEFGKGISKSGELIEIGLKLGFIKKAGSWYSVELDGENVNIKLGQGSTGAKQTLEDNPELAELLEANIHKHLQEIEN